MLIGEIPEDRMCFLNNGADVDESLVYDVELSKSGLLKFHIQNAPLYLQVKVEDPYKMAMLDIAGTWNPDESELSPALGYEPTGVRDKNEVCRPKQQCVVLGVAVKNVFDVINLFENECDLMPAIQPDETF